MGVSHTFIIEEFSFNPGASQEEDTSAGLCDKFFFGQFQFFRHVAGLDCKSLFNKKGFIPEKSSCQQA
jgi:hypothetical protein